MENKTRAKKNLQKENCVRKEKHMKQKDGVTQQPKRKGKIP